MSLIKAREKRSVILDEREANVFRNINLYDIGSQ